MQRDQTNATSEKKAELLKTSEDRYTQLTKMLDEFTPAQLKAGFPFEHRDQNVRDVVAHLHHWHLLLMQWYEVGMTGAKPEMPAKGYTWRTTPELNQAIHSQYQRSSLKRVREKLDTSHNALMQIADGHTNIELFTKRRYAWTGTTSLGSYLTSAMPSHYDWAMKILKRYAHSLR